MILSHIQWVEVPSDDRTEEPRGTARKHYVRTVTSHMSAAIRAVKPSCLILPFSVLFVHKSIQTRLSVNHSKHQA